MNTKCIVSCLLLGFFSLHSGTYVTLMLTLWPFILLMTSTFDINTCLTIFKVPGSFQVFTSLFLVCISLKLSKSHLGTLNKLILMLCGTCQTLNGWWWQTLYIYLDGTHNDRSMWLCSWTSRRFESIVVIMKLKITKPEYKNMHCSFNGF